MHPVVIDIKQTLLPLYLEVRSRKYYEVSRGLANARRDPLSVGGGTTDRGFSEP